MVLVWFGAVELVDVVSGGPRRANAICILKLCGRRLGPINPPNNGTPSVKPK